MLYGIDGKPLGQDQQDEQAGKLYHIQLSNMMLHQRERLFNIVDQCNRALERMDAPDHKLEVRLITDIRDKALATINTESIAGYVSGMQTRMAYEICNRLEDEAKLFDGEDGNECQKLVRGLIEGMLKKLAATTETAVSSV